MVHVPRSDCAMRNSAYLVCDSGDDERCGFGQAMPPVDLTLAVNFVPAVLCLFKSALISLALCMLHPGEHLGGFVLLATVLNVDRVVSSKRIFDENAVQCCILASWVINYLRAMADAPKVVEPMVTFLWVYFGLFLVVEPRRWRVFFVMYGQGSGGVIRRMLPVILTSACVSIIAFTPLAQETCFLQSGRTMAFSCLCTLWVYAVGVWHPRPRRHGLGDIFECHLLLSRFCLVLYVHPIVASIFGALCVGLIMYRHFHMQNHPPEAEHELLEAEEGSRCSDAAPDSESVLERAKSQVSISVSGAERVGIKGASSQASPNKGDCSLSALMVSGPVGGMAPIAEEETDEELEAYFRSACQSRQIQ